MSLANDEGSSHQRHPERKQKAHLQNNEDSGTATVIVKRDAKNTIIIAIGSVIFFPRWLRDRFALYLHQPLYLFLDLPLWGLLSSLLLSLGYLIFSGLYYGTDLGLFSRSWSLFLIAYAEKIVLWTEIAAIALVAIILPILWALRLKRRGKKQPDLPWGINTFQAALISPLALVMASTGLIGISHLTRARLIPLNTQISLSRAHELVSAGLFEEGRAILVQLPADSHLPPYAMQHPGPDSNNSVSVDYQEQQVKSVIEPILADYFSKEEYLEAMQAICQLPRREDISNALPWWREATYLLAHDINYGTDRTTRLTNQLVDDHPLCKEIASPFWMAIPPGLAKEIDAKKGVAFSIFNMEFLYSAGIDYDSDTLNINLKDRPVRDSCKSSYDQPDSPSFWSRLCEYDLSLLEQLLSTYPGDTYADIARFMLGRYDEILAGGIKRSPHVLDMAYYEKGRRQFNAHDYEGAIHTYQSFLYLKEFADHAWRDDAQWRIAQSYAAMGRYKDAFAHLSQMGNEPDGDVPNYADMRHSTLYLADVVVPLQDLQQIVDLNLFPNIRPILLYTLAERQLVENNYEEALKDFNEVIDQYEDTPIVPSQANTFGQLAHEKIGVAQVLKGYRDKNTPDYPLMVADYLETYDSFSPFENDLRFYIPLYYDEPIPIDYITRRSQPYLTATLREKFLAEHPNDPRQSELLYKIGAAYETVASWDLLPSSQQFLDDVRAKAVKAYMEYIDKLPNDNPTYLDRAMEHAGSLFMLRCLAFVDYSYIPCDHESLQGMRDVYNRLVDRLPHHHLANNLLNWVAFSYCYEANLPTATEAEYREDYQNALLVYEKIAKDYPDGLTGQNARDNIQIIKQKLASNQHEPVDYTRWGWYSP